MRGKEIAVRRGSAVATRGRTETPINTRVIPGTGGPIKNQGRSKKGLAAGAAAVGAVGAAGYLFDKSSAGKKSASDVAKQGAEGTKRQTMRDKYGRQIGRAEYNRREKFRESLKGKTPKQAEQMRKAELKRRSEWRKTDGKKKFGVLASKKSRNLDVPVGQSVRKKRQGPASPQWLAERERFK
jgi:hypothetical protein